MINKLKAATKKWIYSLRARMVLFVVLGAVLATIAYMLSRFLMLTVVDAYYATDEARSERENQYIVELQAYIDENRLSSSNTDEIVKWVSHNRYATLYMDGQFFLPGGFGGIADFPQFPGGSLDYPTAEEMKDYAEKNDLHTLRLADGTLLASVSDFSEYFYYDIANFVSLIVAFIVLAIVMMSYFFGITRRIATLSQDVTIVSEVNMNHTIHTEGNDEVATLSRNVEQMRSSILETTLKEKEALNANAELITSMSHDIRTPLTVLLGYIDLMKSRADDPVMQDYIRATETTALRLKELSDDMFRYFLVFGKEEIEVDMNEYDASTLLEQLLAEHILLLSENGYEYAAESEGDIDGELLIYTDAPRAMRIVDNIFSNIYKYADDTAPISFGMELSGDILYVTVRNKIKPRSDRTESTGVGLKTCRRLAEAIEMIFESKSEGGIFVTKMGFKVINKKESNTSDKL